MSPLHKQGRVKAQKRSVQMNGLDEHEDADVQWRCPPLEECDDPPEGFPHQLPGVPISSDRVISRMIYHLHTGEFVRFVLVQQTKYQGSFRDVVEVDTCHDDEVHLHQYCRSTLARNRNDPEVLCEVHAVEDIQTGYNLAYDRVFDMWEENLWRWSDG